MSFPFIVYLLAGVSAAVVTFITLPLWRKVCVRVGLVDDPGHRKIHKETIPLAGGLAVFTGLVIPTLLGALIVFGPDNIRPGFLDRAVQLRERTAAATTQAAGEPDGSKTASADFLLRHGLNRRALELGAILLGALGMLLVGVVDDRHELSPRTKFAGQLFIALLVAASGARITLFVPNLIFSYAITVLWILTVTNAFNFMDNMNGLCAGIGAIGAWYFGKISAADDQYLVAMIAFLTLGALLGFLPHNYPKARAFLGDGGSHLVGYLLAVLAILPHFYTTRHQRHWAVMIPLLVLFVPLLDLTWVVLWRWKNGKPFYVGDTNHLSHRLVRAGMKPSTAVLVLWLVAVAAGALTCLR